MTPDPDSEQAKNLLKNQGSELKKRYNAHSIGVGTKMEKGRLTNKTAIVFYVDKKKTPEELKREGITPVPDDIGGIPTDVVEVSGGFKPR